MTIREAIEQQEKICEFCKRIGADDCDECYHKLAMAALEREEAEQK